MPYLQRRRGDALPWVLLAVVLIGCKGGGGNTPPATDDLANKIHQYLGNNHGTDPSKWSGLVGSIEAANAFHREQYAKIGCSLWMLEHPGQPKPNPCPPGGGTSRPPSPPLYP